MTWEFHIDLHSKLIPHFANYELALGDVKLAASVNVLSRSRCTVGLKALNKMIE